MKSKVYVETSIISYLIARPSNDIRVAANQNITIEWWQYKSNNYDLFVSEFVIAECSQGDQDAAKRRLELIHELPELLITERVKKLGKALVTDGPIPENSEIDAYHIAVAAMNGMDYLLTWNCKHIANAAMRSQIEMVCWNHNLETPVICTPQELLED